MTATIYEWGDRIGVQWDELGPIVIVTREGDVSIKYNPPADAEVLVSTGDDPRDDEPYDMKSYEDGYDDGYLKGFSDGRQDMLNDVTAVIEDVVA